MTPCGKTLKKIVAKFLSEGKGETPQKTQGARQVALSSAGNDQKSRIIFSGKERGLWYSARISRRGKKNAYGGVLK